MLVASHFLLFSLLYVSFLSPQPLFSLASVFTLSGPKSHYPLPSTFLFFINPLPILPNWLCSSSISQLGLSPTFLLRDFLWLSQKVRRAPAQVFTPLPSLDLPLVALLLVGLFPLTSFIVWWQSLSCLVQCRAIIFLIFGALFGVISNVHWRCWFFTVGMRWSGSGDGWMLLGFLLQCVFCFGLRIMFFGPCFSVLWKSLFWFYVYCIWASSFVIMVCLTPVSDSNIYLT